MPDARCQMRQNRELAIQSGKGGLVPAQPMRSRMGGSGIRNLVSGIWSGGRSPTALPAGVLGTAPAVRSR
jgi:hypothetical protein